MGHLGPCHLASAQSDWNTVPAAAITAVWEWLVAQDSYVYRGTVGECKSSKLYARDDLAWFGKLSRSPDTNDGHTVGIASRIISIEFIAIYLTSQVCYTACNAKFEIETHKRPKDE